MGKDDANPMQSAHASPRCKARSKRTGQPCRGPAVKGWTVCRMHGAGGGAPRGPSHGNYRHGCRSIEAQESRKMVNALARLIRETIS
jgi:hypothetical protein